MSKGKVKFFNSQKGFGFIVDDKTGKEIFVHVSGCDDEIKQDDHVSFDLVDGKKGPNCVDVKIIG